MTNSRESGTCLAESESSFAVHDREGSSGLARSGSEAQLRRRRGEHLCHAVVDPRGRGFRHRPALHPRRRLQTSAERILDFPLRFVRGCSWDSLCFHEAQGPGLRLPSHPLPIHRPCFCVSSVLFALNFSLFRVYASVV